MSDFGQTLHLLPYFMCVDSEGCGRLRGCAGSPESLLVAYVISTIISWAGSNHLFFICQKLLKLNTSDSVSTSAHLFSVESSLLPNYIPVRVANKILFVGESIQMFQDQGKTLTQKKGNTVKKKKNMQKNVLYHPNIWLSVFPIE